MILDNPFHVIGLPADCTPREKTRRVSRIRTLFELGKPLLFDDGDFYFEGCRRNRKNVERSLAALDDANDRIGYGLFWFTRSGILDDRAISRIRHQDFRGALEDWGQIEKIFPTPEYASSLNNFGTLCLLIGIKARSGWPSETSVRTDYLLRGLRAKAKIVGHLSGQDLANYCATFSDDVVTRDPENVAAAFGRALDKFVVEAERYGVELDSESLIQTLEDGGARTAALKSRYASAARERLDKAVRACETILAAGDKSRAAEAGTLLMDIARKQLPELVTVLDIMDYKVYKIFADRIAQKLLDAAIVYYNHHMNAKTMSLKVAQTAASIIRYAVQIACGETVRKRGQQTYDIVQKTERQQRRIARALE